MYTTFLYPFICPSVFGLFPCFGFVNMLKWTWLYRYLSEILISLPLDIYLKVGLVDQMAVFFVIFWRICMLFFIMVSYINLHAHQQNSNYLFFPHPYQHLFSFVFWIIALLTDMRWNIVILICISTMINEPFFIYLLITGLSSFKKYLCRFLARFLIGLTFCCSSGVAVQLIWY